MGIKDKIVNLALDAEFAANYAQLRKEEKKVEKQEEKARKIREDIELREKEHQEEKIREEKRKAARKLAEEKIAKENDESEKKRDKERIEKLWDILTLNPIDRIDIIGFRIVQLDTFRYHYGNYGSVESEKYYLMSLLELIDSNKKRYYLYNDKNGYECMRDFFAKDYEAIAISANKDFCVSRFFYLPYELEESANVLERIVPRFSSVRYEVDTASDYRVYNHSREPVFRVERACELIKAREVRFVGLDDITFLNADIVKRIHRLYENWISNNYTQLFEVEPTEFWKEKIELLESVFDVSGVSDAKAIEAGCEGERQVEYALKWLSQEYIVMEKGESGIYLRYPALTDEKQEIDHVVIGTQGVFLIETKNYAGKIVIDEQGNWTREKQDGKVEGERNPVQQVERHHKLVEAILGIKDIHDIICIANEKCIIRGANNSPVPVVKSDMLSYYIENFKDESGKVYSKVEMTAIKDALESHRV